MSARLSILKKIRKGLRSFRDDENGFILAFGVVLVPVLIFAAGLVIDVGFSLQERSKAQGAADFAAIAGAEMLAMQGSGLVQAQQAAYAVASRNGYPSGVTANYPWSSTFNPTVGNYRNSNPAASPYTLEVRILKTRNNIFGSFFNILTTDIGVRAVASYQSNFPCIVILNNTPTAYNGVNGLRVTSNGSSLITPCGIYINSPDARAAIDVGPGTVCGSPNTTPPYVGNIYVNGAGAGQNTSGICSSLTVQTGLGQTIANPYAYLNTTPPNYVRRSTFTYTGGTGTVQSDGTLNGQDGKKLSCGSTCTITIDASSNFPDGLTIEGSSSSSRANVTFLTGNHVFGGPLTIINADVTLQSGVYYIGGTGLSMTRATVSTENFPTSGSPITSSTAAATLALTNANSGTIALGASATLNLNGPSQTSSASYPGFAIVQSPPTGTVTPVNGGTVGGGAVLNLNGLVVMPNTNLTFSSGGSNAATCTGFTVWTLWLSGNASAVDGCQINSNTTGRKSAELVE